MRIKNWLLSSNDKYDNIKSGTKRFLIFFIPMMFVIIGMQCDFTLFGVSKITTINIKLISCMILCLGGLWRLSPKFLQKSK